MIQCERYGHDWNDDDVCAECGINDNADDGDGDEAPYVISGKTVYLDRECIERAKTLLREHNVISVNEAYKVVEILEKELDRSPFDQATVNTMIIALRETEDERKAMALAVSTIDEIVHEKEVSSCLPQQ